MAQEIITLENLAAEIAKLRGELATWKALAIKQDRLSTAQMLAVNSGATAGKIAQIATNTSDIAALQQIASSAFRVVKVAQLPASGEPYIMYLVPQTDGETLNYCNEYLWIDNAWELVGTTGAMANNGELQIIVNGVTVGTFTANQATNSTASITVPTDTSQLTNGAGYVDATALATALASKQDSLSLAQLAAVNSGITSADVAQIGANTTAIAGKQDALTTSQLAAVNSGITSADVTQIGTNAGNIATNSAAIISLQGSKQNALSAAQLLAVNSGITSSLVTQIGTNQSDITTLNTALGQSLTPSADDTYSLGGASFRYANVYAVTFTGDLTGTASKAIADEDGTSIKTGYVNVAGNQTVSGSKDWSNLQTFSYGQIRIKSLSQEIGVIPSASVIQYLEFADKNNVQHGKVGLWDYDNGASEIQLSILDKYKNGVKDATGTSDTAFLSFGFQYNGTKFITFSGQVNNSVIPLATNAYSLGSSSYQWSSVYAQTYYYNGTQWGLDQANAWTNTNTFSADSYGELIRLKNTGLDLSNGNPALSSAYNHLIWWDDKNNAHYAKLQAWTNDNTSAIVLTSYYRVDANTVRTSSLKNYCNASSKMFFPESNADTELGTSTNKWKTLNGVSPGALSLPTRDYYSYMDIDTTSWNITGTSFNYTPTIDAWMMINVSPSNNIAYVSAEYGTMRFNSESTTGRNAMITIPVLANKQVSIVIVGASIVQARLLPCQGNV